MFFKDLLIDIADVMDIDVYRLGHTFMQLSKTLCINIPSVGKSSTCISLVFTYLLWMAQTGLVNSCELASWVGSLRKKTGQTLFAS